YRAHSARLHVDLRRRPRGVRLQARSDEGPGPRGTRTLVYRPLLAQPRRAGAPLGARDELLHPRRLQVPRRAEVDRRGGGYPYDRRRRLVGKYGHADALRVEVHLLTRVIRFA